MHPLLLSLGVIVAPVLAEPEDQLITNTYGEVLHWETAEIPYWVDAENEAGVEVSAAVEATNNAAAVWTDLPDNDIAWVALGTDTGLHGGLDEENVVYVAEDWTSSPELLALTSVWSDEEGVIHDIDVAVNFADHRWGTDGAPEVADLWNALAHEFGHALGLGHDLTDAQATMYGAAINGETSKRDLAPNDEAAADLLYEGAFEELGAPAQGFTCTTVPMGAASLCAVPAAMLALLRRREPPC